MANTRLTTIRLGLVLLRIALFLGRALADSFAAPPESTKDLRHEALWRSPPIRPQGFQFEIQLLGPTAS
jgi:hypothetical protein